MRETKFKIGDVVALNSESPSLTVTSVSVNDDNEEWVGVVFFRDGKFNEYNILSECVFKQN